MVQTSLEIFLSYAAAVRSEIDAALGGYTEFDRDCPPRLAEAIRYMLLSPGKRLRPLLVLMASEACGYERSRAMAAACAVEMVHTYSLIHDDLPAMDDDDMRRGRPSCHVQFDEATAILAGDALLALAFRTLATGTRPATVAAACCAELAQAAGPSALVGGQVDDLDARTSDHSLSQLEAIHRRKTGAMFRVSLRLGGLIAAADEKQMAVLSRYADDLGLAFQITDDLLDVHGEASAIGKTVGKDLEQGKLTFPILLGVDASRARARQLIDEACLGLEAIGEGAVHLEALARYVLERDR
jgi:geranylgeranyl diphosphate synthase type II